MLNTIDLMALNAKYHKYRPDIPLKGNVKQWWLFAYNAIIETQIKPKRNQFKWQQDKAGKIGSMNTKNSYQQKIQKLQICTPKMEVLTFKISGSQKNLKKNL